MASLALLLLVDALAGTRLQERALAMDMTDPVSYVYGFATIALLLPVVLLVRRWVGPRPVGLLSSVAGRLRRGWLGRALAVALVVHLVSFAVQLAVVDPLLGTPLTAPRLVPGAAVFLAAAVLLVPLQSAAEEYVFRGVLMQAIGSWLRHPGFAVLLPVPLFVLGHDYDLWGQLDIAVFAVTCGWITWRTGGLEAAIALHVANNCLLTVLVAVGWSDPNATEGSPAALAASVLTMAVATLLLVRQADRLGVERRRPVPAAPASPGASTRPDAAEASRRPA
ncbi:CPBP family intramembrane metalloprotease [Auraticoccus sp. F435]|uniref:CPBP family intramembrane metalloprotease n=2 Tax=Auraticoccus cholistanensis TaxID=2656650 RepID=A0A6A9UXG4_9ACTN|nr:CPBP family intramembrane metalloprotease [Auraticoccus cholistanensis]